MCLRSARAMIRRCDDYGDDGADDAFDGVCGNVCFDESAPARLPKITTMTRMKETLSDVDEPVRCLHDHDSTMLSMMLHHR